MISENATSNPSETTANPQAERNENGQFRKGNAGGPGNPFARQSARLRQALLNAVSEAELLEVIEMLKRKAREGDVAAARLLLSYTVGKPAAAPNPDRLDFDEFEILVKNHNVPLNTMASILDAMTVDQLLRLARGLMPLLADIKWQKMKDAINTPPEKFDEDLDGDDGDQDSGEEEDESEDGEEEERSELPAAVVPAWMEDMLREYGEQAQEAQAQTVPASIEERLAAYANRPAAGNGAPSRNGANGKRGPSPNGSNGKGSPSPNGHNGKHTA